MIMRKGEPLLLPANPIFIWSSFAVALLINMLPFAQVIWQPDVLLLVLVFWSLHQPEKVGMGIAFVFGILMDVHEAGLLGQHALAYCIASFFALRVGRRLMWFSASAQALQIFPILVGAHTLQMFLRMALGGVSPGWLLIMSPMLEALLWPLMSFILLAPQRRAPNPDAHRPL